MQTLTKGKAHTGQRITGVDALSARNDRSEVIGENRGDGDGELGEDHGSGSNHWWGSMASEGEGTSSWSTGMACTRGGEGIAMACECGGYGAVAWANGRRSGRGGASGLGVARWHTEK